MSGTCYIRYQGNPGYAWAIQVEYCDYVWYVAGLKHYICFKYSLRASYVTIAFLSARRTIVLDNGMHIVSP